MSPEIALNPKATVSLIKYRVPWAERRVGVDPVKFDVKPRVAFEAGKPNPEVSLDTLLNSEGAFNRFLLSTYVTLMIDTHGGTTNPDGSRTATIQDFTAKEGDIRSVTFTEQPKSDTGRGGLSIEVTKRIGNGATMTEDLRLGSIGPTDTDYHHATIITSVYPSSDAVSTFTGESLSDKLASNITAILPETRPAGEAGGDLRTTGRKFCRRIADWAEEVTTHEH